MIVCAATIAGNTADPAGRFGAGVRATEVLPGDVARTILGREQAMRGDAATRQLVLIARCLRYVHWLGGFLSGRWAILTLNVPYDR